ncbi:MAG: hypothetical protein ABSG88_16575 [Bradyrhizobium sp.]
MMIIQPPIDPEIEAPLSKVIEGLVDADGNVQRAAELEGLIAEAGNIIAKLNRLLTGADFAKELKELQMAMQKICADAQRQVEIRSKFNNEFRRRLELMKKSEQILSEKK